MKILIVGASKGLGKAFVEGLCQAGDQVISVSRQRPSDIALPAGVQLDWIEANLGQPLETAQLIVRLPLLQPEAKAA